VASPEQKGGRPRPAVRSVPITIKARYDAAQTTDANAGHWSNTDALSADEAASVDVRKRIRERARYEAANNCYARGIVNTLANDCVGTGPRLQMLTDDAGANSAVESAFNDWSKAVDLAKKLRTMRSAKAVDGEAFAVLTANPMLPTPVTLDLQLIEADRVTSPSLAVRPDHVDIDGLILDPFGNPKSYEIMQYHPGDTNSFSAYADMYDTVPAESVLHWFRPDRPGQHRGVSELSPAIPLFEQMRRYTLAVLAAAETAADFAAVLYTDSPANGEADDSFDALDIIELEARMATTLPDGWKLGQIKAEQPTTTYAEFKAEILNEIARCLNMPYNIAAGNSAGYNYASGRLDHQTYFKSIRIEQEHLAQAVLDRVFAAWFAEARITLGIARPLGGVKHQWFFDGTEHVDPNKEAAAQAKRLANHTTTLAYEYARQGRDWESELRQEAKERELMLELGLISDESDQNME